MSQRKMAAPCRRMASRSLLQFLSYFCRTAGCNTRLRQFSGPSVCRGAVQTRTGTEGSERSRSPWTLTAAVCLQRLPVISAERSPIEQRVTELLQQLELEKSVLSEHELRLLDDAERMRRKQADDYDSDEEEEHGADDIVLAQDLEDSWEQRLKSFQPAPRVKDVDNEPSSLRRRPADALLLLARQPVGDERLWLLPQSEWRDGETLRQTAQRAINDLPAGFQATFLGNAPCGVYKYKLPQASRTEASVGTKVFFFKALLSDASLLSDGVPPPAAPDASLLWVKRSELQRYLRPAYRKKVDSFLLDL